MKKLILIVIMLVSVSISHSYEFGEKWNRADTVLQATYVGVTLIDFAQTHWMARQDWKWNGKQHSEYSPYFSDRPHQDETWAIPIAIVLHTIIAVALPPKHEIMGITFYPRRTWQLVWIGLEVGAVTSNASLGVKIEF